MSTPVLICGESYTASTARTRRKSTCHCWLLDRRDRRAHISQRDEIMMLFALGEPEEGDGHNGFVDGLLKSPGRENYKLPPAPKLLIEFRQFLDIRVPIEQGA